MACGLTVRLASRAALGLVLPKSLPAASMGAATLSAGFAAVVLLGRAHSVAPFWKTVVVVAFATAFMVANVVAAFSSSWLLFRGEARPSELVNLAESVGFLSVALVALLVSVRQIQSRRAPT